MLTKSALSAVVLIAGLALAAPAAAQFRVNGPVQLNPDALQIYTFKLNCALSGAKVRIINIGLYPVPAGKTLEWAIPAEGTWGGYTLTAPLLPDSLVVVAKAYTPAGTTCTVKVT